MAIWWTKGDVEAKLLPNDCALSQHWIFLWLFVRILFHGSFRDFLHWGMIAESPTWRTTSRAMTGTRPIIWNTSPVNWKFILTGGDCESAVF